MTNAAWGAREFSALDCILYCFNLPQGRNITLKKGGRGLFQIKMATTANILEENTANIKNMQIV